MYWLSQFGQLSKSFSSCWDLYENKSKMQRVVTVASPAYFQLVWANPSVLRGGNLNLLIFECKLALLVAFQGESNWKGGSVAAAAWGVHFEKMLLAGRQ